jgi:ergothioneine biosynthesis protein EgtB
VTVDRNELLRRYRETRALSVKLCQPLHPEDYRIQSMPDVSPPWWNLGHTTWFFAKNILEPFGRYSAGDARLEFVMNSYYESLGPRIRRDHRGLVTRPTNSEVYEFRDSVDGRVEALIQEASEGDLERLRFLVYTGVQHEQQHQELLVTELKHILGSNVPELREPYRAADAAERADGHGAPPARWVSFDGDLREIGNVEGGWCWDNEMPVHKAWIEGFSLMNRLVTNGEYLEFMADGGYRNPLLWLSNGWAKVKEQDWTAPLYWEEDQGRWRLWTLAGVRDVDPDEPVCHVGFYEADAYARWKGARLPTEREWEHAARVSGLPGSNYLDSGALHPLPAGLAENDGGGLLQMGGDLWEWTSNHYEPYPGYKPFEGPLMEYNGKFMDNVRVLRGGSCATPANHIRASYRNFWPGDTRFQFTGIRLAKDA